MFSKTPEKFISGNEAAVEGAKVVGASCMCGYPITPATELLQAWVKLHEQVPNKYKLIQAEDEISAGFNTIGAILAGAKSFTATAGPGTILMQDPITMAEAMRIPYVGIIMQRGGPSTGTVVYGQQEVTMTCFGGNGEGLRIVYSVSNPQELYDYTIKAFNSAWKYRFPTFVLGDGYSAKMKSMVKLYKPRTLIESKPIIGGSSKSVNIRNCFNFEDELYKVLKNDIDDFERSSNIIVESVSYRCRDANIVLVAHGIVASSAKDAVDKLREKGKKVGLFRPITLRPFDYVSLSRLAANVKKMIIIESAYGHLERIVKQGLYGLTKIETYQKPVMAIDPDEIVGLIK